MSRIPAIYSQPYGVPLYWRDEQSGDLYTAIAAYLDHCVDNRTVTDTQIALVRDYLAHWINAPCWNSTDLESEMLELRSSVRDLESATDIQSWTRKALEIGIDPL